MRSPPKLRLSPRLSRRPRLWSPVPQRAGGLRPAPQGTRGWRSGKLNPVSAVLGHEVIPEGVSEAANDVRVPFDRGHVPGG